MLGQRSISVAAAHEDFGGALAMIREEIRKMASKIHRSACVL